MSKRALAGVVLALLAIAVAINRLTVPSVEGTVPRAYQTSGPFDWIYLPDWHQDVSEGAKCYVVDNGVARLVIGTEIGVDNGRGAFRPGWVVDFGLPYGSVHEGLDWTEWTLQEKMDAAPEHPGKWIDLSDIRVEGRDIVARGFWMANPAVKAEVRYTLLPAAPVARLEMTLQNDTEADLKLFLGYFIDYDHGNDASIPGAGWNAPFVSRVPSDNYIYGGRRDGRLAYYALAWRDTEPTGVVAAGPFAGLWFDAFLRSRERRTVAFYHLVGSDGTRKAPNRAGFWAHKIGQIDPKAQPRARVDGIVTDGQGEPVAGALVFAKTAEGRVAVRTRTLDDGRYQFGLAPGQYTLKASLTGYVPAVRSLQVESATRHYRRSFVIPPIEGVWAGSDKRLRGIVASGTVSDTVIENAQIAVAIGDATRVSPLGLPARGKILDVACAGGEDSLLGAEMPYVAAQRPVGRQPWLKAAVTYREVDVVARSARQLTLRAQGDSTANPAIHVTTDYVLEWEAPWVIVESTLRNTATTAARLFIGDALVSGKGAVSVVPGTGPVPAGNEPAQFVPDETWFAQIGATPQMLVLDYGADATGLTYYGGGQAMMSAVPATLAPGGTVSLRRRLACIPRSRAVDPDLAIAQIVGRMRLDAAGLDLVVTPAADEVFLGQALNVQLAVRNTGERPTGPVRVRLEASGSLAVTGAAERRFDSLAPGEVRTAGFRVAGAALGRGIFQAVASVRSKEYPPIPVPLFVNGPGWYLGDMHTHTHYSDGSGSVAQNVAAAQARGFSFLAISDHNTVIQADDVAEEQYPGFLTLVGEELSGGYGHANAVPLKEWVDFKLPVQEIADRVREQGGLLFINHPFHPLFPWKPWDVQGYTGIEVWNGFHPPDHSENARAFALWDKMLNQGVRVVGMASSDAHTPEAVGRVYIGAYLDSLSEEAIREALARGRFYGTNGPTLSFEVNGAIMGSSVRVRSGQKASLSVEVVAPTRVNKVTVIRNGRVLKEWFPNSSSFEATLDDVPGADTWYRVTASCDEGGFAFSNPVWVRRQ